MTIDLNKILARQDYVKLTKSLREKCDQLESVVSDKMVVLELDGRNGGITVNNMRIFCIKGFLFVRTPEKDQDCGLYCGYSEYRQIISVENDVENVDDDINNRHFVFYPCSNKHALRFLNNAVAIIEKLGEIEQEKVDNIEKALESAKNI